MHISHHVMDICMTKTVSMMYNIEFSLLTWNIFNRYLLHIDIWHTWDKKWIEVYLKWKKQKTIIIVFLFPVYFSCLFAWYINISEDIVCNFYGYFLHLYRQLETLFNVCGGKLCFETTELGNDKGPFIYYVSIWSLIHLLLENVQKLCPIFRFIFDSPNICFLVSF